MYAKFLACTSKLRSVVQHIPEMQLLAEYRHQPYVEDDEDETLWAVPDLSDMNFQRRTLVEGLLGNGIVRPSDLPALLEALKQDAPAEAFSLRVLESLFTEDRIREPKAAVIGMSRQIL